MNLRKPKIVTSLFFYITLVIVVIGRWRGYQLSWDDADYLRMSSCFSFLQTYLSLDHLRQCEYALYKSPIFAHLGIFQLLLTLVWSGTSPEDLISAHLLLLLFLLLLCLFQISRYLHSLRAKIMFYSITVLMMLSELHTYMTDQLVATLSGILVLHYVKSKRYEITESVVLTQFALAFLLLGVRTTCFPLFLLPLLSFLRYAKSSNRRTGFVLVIIASSVLYFVLFLSLWRSVIPTAFAMAFGNMSVYFKTWVEKDGINLTQIAADRYASSIFLILLFIFSTKSTRKALSFCKKNAEAFLPSFSLLITVVLSNPDPRFLLWPTYALLLLLIFSIDDPLMLPIAEDRIKSRSIFVIALFPLLTLIAPVIISSESKYGLTSAIAVHAQIPATGTVCPISDSPELNISKVMLVDSLLGIQKELGSRIVNVPDSAMNGLTLDYATKTTLNCDFIYYDTSVISGGPKNEYFEDLKLALVNQGYFIEELEGRVAYFVKD